MRNRMARKTQSSQTVLHLARHRNGMGGVPFHAALVEEVEGGQTRTLLVVRFPQHHEAEGVLCAAFDLALLDARRIDYGDNSWRGERYAQVVDAAIARGVMVVKW